MNLSCWLFFHNYYLLFAITFAAIDTVTASTECSRELSRQVRKTFVQEVYPQLSVSPEQLPVDCELNPLIDKFRIQEKQKTEVAMTDWQCKICGKRFVSEYYLDRHMDNKHLHEISSNATYCLAELCPMIGCTEPSRISGRQRRNSHELNRNPTGLKKKKFLFKTPCNEGEAVALRNGCQDIALRCFNNSIDEAKFMSRICNQISCKGGFLMGVRNKWKNNDTDTMIASRGILVYIFKFMFAFFVIAAIILQVSMSTTSLRDVLSWQRFFPSGSSSTSQSRDAVAEFERRRQRQMKKNWAWNFLETVVNPVLSAFRPSKQKMEKQK